MEEYVKEICCLENGETEVNIFRYNADNTWDWMVHKNEVHEHSGGGDLDVVLSQHMGYIRKREKDFAEIRSYVILTRNQLEEELFYLGL